MNCIMQELAEHMRCSVTTLLGAKCTVTFGECNLSQMVEIIKIEMGEVDVK